MSLTFSGPNIFSAWVKAGQNYILNLVVIDGFMFVLQNLR
jgi:hypothetical protein